MHDTSQTGIPLGERFKNVTEALQAIGKIKKEKEAKEYERLLKEALCLLRVES
ncbi:hypothetical protein KAU88_03585 [Candidatus Bathyarchaeota archaeon]|nr:hypothetical protein [Candidatus Bathyarchaeota archaeon]